MPKRWNIIPEGSSIGWGGSMSIKEMGLMDAVCSGNYTVYNRTSARRRRRRERPCSRSSTQTFSCAAPTAITEDGVLVNVDGTANRVSCISWGTQERADDRGHEQRSWQAWRTPCPGQGMRRRPSTPSVSDWTRPAQRPGCGANCKSPDHRVLPGARDALFQGKRKDQSDPCERGYGIFKISR